MIYLVRLFVSLADHHFPLAYQIKIYFNHYMSLSNLSAQQLRKAATLKEQIEALHKQLEAIIGSTGVSAPSTAAKPAKRKISAAHKAKIRAAQKARWAKVRAAKPAEKPAPKKKGKISAAGIARIKAAQKARWAAIKAKAVVKPAASVTAAQKPVATATAKPVAASNPPKTKSKMSVAQKAKIRAKMKAYWAAKRKK